MAPQEDANAMISELKQQSRALTACAQTIQHANANNYLLDENDQETDMTLQAALIERDGLTKEQEILRSLASDAVPNTRYSRSEILLIPMVDSKELLKYCDGLAKEIRRLNLLIQKTNWQIDV